MMEALKDIEIRVEKGEDVRRDFWKVVGVIKRRKRVDDEILVMVAELRDKIFKKKVILEYSKGAKIFVLFFIIVNALLFFVVSRFDSLIMLFITESMVLYFSFLTGRIVGAKISGIKVEGFYLYNPLEFGMKLDYLSYLKTTQKNRVIFFMTPILFEHLVLAIHSTILFFLKSWLYWVPLTLLVLNISLAYVVYKIKKTGELYRVLREFRILKS